MDATELLRIARRVTDLLAEVHRRRANIGRARSPDTAARLEALATMSERCLQRAQEEYRIALLALTASADGFATPLDNERKDV